MLASRSCRPRASIPRAQALQGRSPPSRDAGRPAGPLQVPVPKPRAASKQEPGAAGERMAALRARIMVKAEAAAAMGAGEDID